MRRAAEIAAFLGLSAVVHAGVVAGFGDALGGPQGQGAGGTDRVTLQAAPESLAALADRWTAAPVTVETPVALQAPEPIDRVTPLMTDSTAPRASLPTPPSLATLPSPPRAADPAPRLLRPEVTDLTTAPAPTLPDPAPVPPTASDSPDALRIPPGLVAPEAPVDPVVTSTPPPPPETSALATLTSPRPATRPDAPPQPTSAPASTRQAERVAAGAGSGTTQGAAPAPAAAPAALSTAQRQSLMAHWGGQILARIERARPNMRASGQVVLTLQVARNGQLAGLSVSRSSGDPALDEAALSAVRRAGRFPAAPEDLTDAAYAFSLPIRFR